MSFHVSQLWPKEVAEFKPASLNVYYEFQEFAFRICDVLGEGLGLKVCVHLKQQFYDRWCPNIKYPNDFSIWSHNHLE